MERVTLSGGGDNSSWNEEELPAEEMRQTLFSNNWLHFNGCPQFCTEIGDINPFCPQIFSESLVSL